METSSIQYNIPMLIWSGALPFIGPWTHRSPISNAGNGFSNAGRTTLAVGSNNDSGLCLNSRRSDTEIDQSDLFRWTDGGQTWLHSISPTRLLYRDAHPIGPIKLRKHNQLIS